MPFRPKKILLHPKTKPFISVGSPIHRALTQFVQDPLPGCHEEKIEAPVLAFTIKVDGKARLLIVPDPLDMNVGLLIKVMEEHNYKEINRKSSAWFDRQIEKAQEYQCEFEEKPLQPEALIPLEVADNMEFCNQQFVLLSKLQQDAKKQSLPLIISGAPGSGKSTLLISILKDRVLQDASQVNKKKYLILTESEYLIDELETEWKQLDEVEDLPACEVHFRTPRQLHEEHFSAPEAASLEEFKTWFTQHIKARQQEGKLTPELRSLVQEQHYVYFELRNMSGYEDLKTYNEEMPDSFYPCQRLRESIWNLKKAYLIHLKKAELIDYSFQTITHLETYEVCLVDEALDLSLQQLRSFGPNTVFFAGDHQSLFGAESILPFIRRMYRNLDERIQVHHCALPASFRCATPIVDLANFFLRLKYFCIGGKKARPDHTIDYVQSAPGMGTGRVIWVADEEELQQLAQDRDNFGLVVVTSLAFFAEAEKLFGKGKVLTVPQVKGLQYESVLIYKMENKDFELVEQAMREFAQNAALASKPSMRQGLAFNGPFVSATRAQKNLYVYLPATGTKPCRNFIEQIKKFILEKFKEDNAALDKYESKISTLTELNRLQEKLYLSGNIEQAEALGEKIITLAESKDETPAAPLEKNPLSVNGLIENFLSPEGIKRFTQNENAQMGLRSLMEDLFLNNKQLLRTALNTIAYKIKSGRITSKEAEHFIGIIESFKGLLGNLLKPFDDFIKQKQVKLDLRLINGQVEAIDSFYRMNPLLSIEEQIKIAIEKSYLVLIEKLHKNIIRKDQTSSLLVFAFLECKRQRMQVIQTLLRLGVDINAAVEGTGTLLHNALQCYVGTKYYFNIIAQLLDWGADPRISVYFDPCKIKTSPFAMAIRGCELEILELFLDKYPDIIINEPSFLLLAVLFKKPEKLDLLLKYYNRPIATYFKTGPQWLSYLSSNVETRSQLSQYVERQKDKQTPLDLSQMVEILGFSEFKPIFLRHEERLKNQSSQLTPKMKSDRPGLFNFNDFFKNSKQLQVPDTQFVIEEYKKETCPLKLDINETMQYLTSPEGFKFFTMKTNTDQILIEHMVLNQYETVKRALESIFDKIKNGKATQAESDFFIGQLLGFRDILEQLIRPYEGLIQRILQEQDIAINKGDPEAIESYLRRMLSPKDLTERDIMIAIENSPIPVIAHVIKKIKKSWSEQNINVNETRFFEKDKYYGLIAFAFDTRREDRLELIKTLIDLDVDINEHVDTPTVMSLAYEEYQLYNNLKVGKAPAVNPVSIFKTLLDFKGDPTLGDPSNTPVALATQAKELNLLKLFHQKGVKLDKGEFLGLHYAVLLGHKDILSFFLKTAHVSINAYFLTGQEWIDLMALKTHREKMLAFIDSRTDQQIALDAWHLAEILELSEMEQIFNEAISSAEILAYKPETLRRLLLLPAERAIPFLLKYKDHLLLKEQLLKSIIEQLCENFREEHQLILLTDKMLKYPSLELFTVALNQLIYLSQTAVVSPLNPETKPEERQPNLALNGSLERKAVPEAPHIYTEGCAPAFFPTPPPEPPRGVPEVPEESPIEEVVFHLDNK